MLSVFLQAFYSIVHHFTVPPHRILTPPKVDSTVIKHGSITSVQAVYVSADDLTDPAPANNINLDTTTILSRRIAGLGIYTTIATLASFSRI